MLPRRLLHSLCVAALLPLAAAPAQASTPPTSASSGAGAVVPGPERTLPSEPWGPRPVAATEEETLTDLEREEPDRLLALVTKELPVDPIDYEPSDLVPFQGGDLELRAEVADQLEEMFEAAEEEGHQLRIISGYRSREMQVETHDYWRRTHGAKVADATSARPGHSEHQTGLAADVDTVRGECTLDQCFGELDEGRWVAEHAHEFGFTISYPEGARQQTGYAYEPWHLRYIGPAAAEEMDALGIELLEDYLSARYTSVRAGMDLGSGL